MLPADSFECRLCKAEGVQQRRWVNQSQPQTLVIAVFLLYFDAAFAVLALLGGAVQLAALAGAGAAYGIANEKKWGYGVGVAVAIIGLLPFVLALTRGANLLAGSGAIGLLFAGAKLALLLHPQSRDYQRIWFT